MNPTMDQVIAKANMGAAVPSIATSVRVGTNSGGTGSNRCFWTGAKQPITPEADPYKLYNMLFAGKMTGGAWAWPTRTPTRSGPSARACSTTWAGSLEKFSRQLGLEDRQIVRGHLDSIRTLENQLTVSPPQLGSCGVMLTAIPRSRGRRNNANNGTLLDLHFQLMIAALKCDATRVTTLQFGDATGGSVSFPQVNVNRNWHSLGHNPGADKIVVDKWVMTQFAGLLDKIKAVPEGPAPPCWTT
jgi:hypothetical protein